MFTILGILALFFGYLGLGVEMMLLGIGLILIQISFNLHDLTQK